MLTDCEKTVATIYGFLGHWPPSITFTPDDLEVAFRHARRCGVCGKSLSPEELVKKLIRKPGFVPYHVKIGRCQDGRSFQPTGNHCRATELFPLLGYVMRRYH